VIFCDVEVANTVIPLTDETESFVGKRRNFGYFYVVLFFFLFFNIQRLPQWPWSAFYLECKKIRKLNLKEKKKSAYILEG
jgi:hypothetical protein